MEWEAGLFDAMRDSGVERVRFRTRGGSVQRLAAPADGAWQDALSLLPPHRDLLDGISRAVGDAGHERLDFVFRAPVGLRFLCAVHRTTLGPGAGGLKRHDPVVKESTVIQDVLNLSRAMTYKNAVAQVQRGGSKLCVHNPPLPPYDREGWLEAVAEEIDLSGTITGPDVGFTKADFLDLASRSDNVTGVQGTGTAGAAAVGVFAALRAAASTFGRPLSEIHVAIQGLGGLGLPLASRLLEEGATLTVTDQDYRKIDTLMSGLLPADRKRVGVVAPYQIHEVESDIWAPCAIPAIVTRQNLDRLRCRAICGGANNQLEGTNLADELDLAARLHHKGILFVPDWMTSCGGTIHGTMEAQQGSSFDPKKAEAKIHRTCGWLVDELLEDSKRLGRSPLELAVERHLRPLGVLEGV